MVGCSDLSFSLLIFGPFTWLRLSDAKGGNFSLYMLTQVCLENALHKKKAAFAGRQNSAH
jgi:hypothetical protein